VRDFEHLRKKMVEEQLVSRGIRDKRVLSAMKKVPRHLFVDEALYPRAYGDYPLPIGEGQTISQPYIVALMTQALELSCSNVVLEVGTGSGYQAAILAELAERVYTIERHRSLKERAERVLRALGYSNIAFRVGDGSFGWSKFAPYDGIVITAGAPSIPKTLFNQLAEGGRMVLPMGDKFEQELFVVRKVNGKPEVRKLIPCAFVPFIGEEGWKEGRGVAQR